MNTDGATEELLDGASHVRRELDWLELRLRREVIAARAERGASNPADEFAGLYISEEEMNRYLAGEDGRPAAGGPELAALDARIASSGQELERQRRRAGEAGRFLQLEHLREAFALEEAERLVLLACLAPELDLRFERYFAYLQNDVSKKRPCLQLLDRLFFGRRGDFQTFRRIVSGEDSLVALRLLEVARPADGAGLASRELKVTEGVVSFVLGVDVPSVELRGLGAWREPRPLRAEDGYFGYHRAHLRRLLESCARDGRIPLTFLRGPEGCGKEELVLAMAHALSAQVLECEAEELLNHGGDFGEWLKVMGRDLRLRTGFLWIRHGERLLAAAEGQRSRLRALGAFLREHPAISVMITAERGPVELRDLLRVPVLELDLPVPSLAERVALWREVLGEPARERPELVGTLASKFKFGPERIRAAVALMDQEASGARPQGAALEPALLQACRAECSPTLDAYARKHRPRYRWEDLVLPPEVLEQLREIVNSVRHRARVHGEWGFDGKFSLGKGLNVLFSGPSGTGKTMSAEILAADLGLELYKIDLSAVVSKYIGETEKNLARIFREAETANCILLFDEADALFGKRSEVKDSHDRYANIEIDYLLQRMEEYEGIVILTTNMMKNLDSAFTRRLQYTVEFPVPDERHRELLWAKVFPDAAPRADDLDLSFLAKRFKLSGASIKNIALNSAFLAAANGGVVDMQHVVTALKREYRKLGKLASRSEFGAYGDLADGAGEAEG